MSMALVEFAEKLVSVSDFSQGKAGKIFNDVAENDHEYIVLKNNQPLAVLVSIEAYTDMQKRLARYEKFLEELENLRLLRLAESRKSDKMVPFEELLKEERISMDELETLAESVEFE